MRAPPRRGQAHRCSAIPPLPALRPRWSDGERPPAEQALRRSDAASITAAEQAKGNAMRGLSISAAWEETRDILTRDGRLLTTVALALIALPAAINTLINPGGIN